MSNNAIANGYDIQKVVIPGAGPILRKYREENKYTQEDVAKRSGFDMTSISRYECERASVNLAVLERLAAAIEVHPQVVIKEAQSILLDKLTRRYKGTDFEHLVEDTRAVVVKETD